LFVCLFVCLFAGLCKNYCTDFHKKFVKDGTWAVKEPDFGGYQNHVMLGSGFMVVYGYYLKPMKMLFHG